MPRGGDGYLQRPTPYDRRVIEVTALRLVHDIAQDAGLLTVPENLFVQFRGIRSGNNQESAVKIGRRKRARLPSKAACADGFGNTPCCLRRHDANFGAATQEALHLGFRLRPPADHQASTSRELQK